jgi:hypothetical protein
VARREKISGLSHELAAAFGSVRIVAQKTLAFDLSLGVLAAGALVMTGKAEGPALQFENPAPGGRTLGAGRLVAHDTAPAAGHLRRHRAVQISGPGQGQVATAAQTTRRGADRGNTEKSGSKTQQGQENSFIQSRKPQEIGTATAFSRDHQH